MVTDLLIGASCFGLLVLLLQRICVGVALRRPPPRPSTTPGISILKPLCGVDEALDENLAAFAALDYPHFEVLLGVKDRDDAAWPLALSWAIRDRRFRVVQQRSAPGLNPKVNQLITLGAEARHPLLLVSDSNARLPPEALREIAARFEDSRVGLVVNPVSGLGHASLGALLDNLYMASSVAAPQLGVSALLGRGIVNGKSMTLRRAALDDLGGFSSVADVLAEDYVMGEDLRAAGWRVSVAVTPVWNVSVQRSVGSFFARYLRWGVIFRTAVSLPASLAHGLINPLPWWALALALTPRVDLALGFLCAAALKVSLDLSVARAVRCGPFDWRVVPAVLLKDSFLFVAWLRGFFVRTVRWRGQRLRVGARSRLLGPTPQLTPARSLP